MAVNETDGPGFAAPHVRFRSRHGPWGLVELGRAGDPPSWQPVRYRTHLGRVGDTCDPVGPPILMYQPTEDDLVSHIPHELPLAFARRLVAELFRQAKDAGGPTL
jgi:hypothetical protein